MGHIGIDVHKRESQICILAEGDEVIERRIRTEPERFAALLGTRPRARIVRRAQLGRDAAARCDHQGRPLASPLAPDSGRRLDPPPPSAAGGDVATWALRLAARRGKQVAVVALARRLAGLLYALLRDGSVLEPQRVRSPRRPAAGAAAPMSMRPTRDAVLRRPRSRRRCIRTGLATR